MIIGKFLFLSFVSVVLGNSRVAIDRESCSGDLYDKVKFYLNAALDRAKLCADQLTPYVQNANTPPNHRIMGQLTRIFGANDNGVALQLHSVYSAISAYHFDDRDAQSPAWKSSRDHFDVEIHCNADHIQPVKGHPEPNIHWRDNVQAIFVYDGSTILELKNPETDTAAVAGPAEPWRDGEAWKPTSPETITFEPGYIKGSVAKNMMFNDDLIKKAMHPSLLSRVRRKLHISDTTQADFLTTPDFILLHEFTHLVVPGRSKDMNAYGWLKSLRVKNTNHADSLALFAMVVDLIMNHGYSVNDQGKIESFTHLR